MTDGPAKMPPLRWRYSVIESLGGWQVVRELNGVEQRRQGSDWFLERKRADALCDLLTEYKRESDDANQLKLNL